MSTRGTNFKLVNHYVKILFCSELLNRLPSCCYLKLISFKTIIVNMFIMTVNVILPELEAEVQVM